MLTATQKLSNVVLMLVGLPSRPTKISAVDAFVPSSQNFWILLALNSVTKMNERSVLSAVATAPDRFLSNTVTWLVRGSYFNNLPVVSLRTVALPDTSACLISLQEELQNVFVSCFLHA